MNIIQVPLPKLVPSAANVRKTGTDDVADLAASIHAHGLLQNLTVIDRGEQFEVVAGGMRLRALQDLAKRKLIAPEYSVPCNVLDAEDAHEASLTENVTRHAMHPADEFDAFNKLATGPEKATAGDIAARFGKSELYVRQRMKLANVAPEIMKEYRAGKATLEQMMALALTDDQALQLRIWKAARQDWQRRPDELREKITADEVSVASGLGKFVGVKAYEEAGGKVRRDLFGKDEDAYLDNPELAEKLALEKLERTAEKIRKEGWAWVEARINFNWQERQKFGEAPSTWKGSKESWSDDAKKHSGAVVHLGHNGQADIERGLVKAKDRQAVEKAANGKVSGGRKAPTARKPGELTFAAQQYLQAECGALIAAQVAKKPPIALALLAADLVGALYSNSSSSPRRWIYIERRYSGRMPGNIRQSPRYKEAARAIEEQAKSWAGLLPKKHSEARAWILEQDEDTVQQLLAFLVAREIDVVDTSNGEKDGIVDLAAAAQVDLGQHWRPTKDWVFTLSKSTVLAMAKDAGATAVELATLGKMPKAKLPEAAAACFNAGWLPKPLRPAAAKKKPAKKAKRAAAGAKS